jgi:hypothetical protein
VLGELSENQFARVHEAVSPACLDRSEDWPTSAPAFKSISGLALFIIYISISYRWSGENVGTLVMT